MELYHPPPPPHPRGEASKNMYFYRNPWTPFTPDNLYTRYLLQFLHQTIFTTNNFYTRHPLLTRILFHRHGASLCGEHINFWSRFAQFGLEGGMCSWLVLFDAVLIWSLGLFSLFIQFCWSLSLLDPHPHPTPKSNKVRWNLKNSTKRHGILWAVGPLLWDNLFLCSSLIPGLRGCVGKYFPGPLSAPHFGPKALRWMRNWLGRWKFRMTARTANSI